MISYNVEDVFKTTGIPTVTYVQPKEYLSLVVAMRTKGKCVVVEGPSGIGKTTAILKVLEGISVGKNNTCKILSARKIADFAEIENVSTGKFEGLIIIDDFHRLSADTREAISNVMKYMADDPDEARKIVVIGINNVGDSLVHFSPDLNNRISTIKFETNSEDKIEELIRKGETALNISFDNIQPIIDNSYGSFHIAQLMCQYACIQQETISTCEGHKEIHFSYPDVLNKLSEEFSRSYFEIAREFATGNRLRREGRAPYLHILKWLSESKTWSINLITAIQQHPQQKAGVVQIVEKGFLEDFLEKHEAVSEYIHYDSISRILSVEDPKLVFFLKTINWNNFARDIGFIQLVETPTYDFALSFAGTDRPIVKKLFLELQAAEIAVFYDENEQANILSANVEEYLYPIYKSEASFVIPFLSKSYPHRLWTKFESKTFKDRFGQNAVIPIWFNDVDSAMFDISKDYGGITFDTNADEDSEVKRITRLLIQKIEEYRSRA